MDKLIPSVYGITITPIHLLAAKRMDSLCGDMPPMVLSESSLFQGLNRRQHSVCNCIRWVGSEKRVKLSHVRYVRLNKENSAYSSLYRVAKKSENIYRMLLISAEYSGNDKSPSMTHNLLESDSGRANQRDGHGLQAFGSEQKHTAHKQLGSLDSYFSKLHGKEDKSQSVAISPDRSLAADVSIVELQPKPDEFISILPSEESQSTKEDKKTTMKTDLNMLESYLEKHVVGAKEPSKDNIPSISQNDRTGNDLTSEEDEFAREVLDFVNLLEKKLESSKQEKASKLTEDKKGFFDELLPSYDGRYNSYLINILVAINIAVYLFELASPVRGSDIGSVSLPLLYGAKINELILDGQWWRLITPTFLHSGLLHVAFSSWALLTFGPLVDRAYGSLAFCMIYFLGGICGNLMSFFHTPDATIGGTGPVFAIIGSWVVYLFQNREAIGEDTADIMIQKIVLASAISVGLSFLTPIDDWTHLGAACAGLLFGILVCPVLTNGPSEKLLSELADDGQDGFLLVRRRDPRRLFTVFTLFVATLVTVFFVFAPFITEFHFPDMSDNF
ncbi:hypothetical protein SUGI_0078910 [Cryptomeria japonica]|nr:hypothetical protein SUGI_0078910 [Cryptomeria japonica]